MPIPKQRHTKSRRNRRRSHHALKLLSMGKCPKCGQEIMPHQVCKNCGTYQGRQVIDVLKKLTKKEQKKRKKELAEQEEQAKTEKPLDAAELSKNNK
ncbi:MAG TPA: 50S ribosomal protein L32 [Candidatus Portnoybacteria bacterium]|uniref:Large ribosomal subunit protein bL32 n=1 Tax=Candidatus Portnoybacteria bacterium CG02_land_8_20_14_3_00_45_8 TaxID=1974807 RepID=A0A2M7D652_9BACT|nr:MAG: 50S ribosomal protein L32 [Candidatus Portnoybacteria bacterium CG02_land_8_20_14_3_00_45_8]HCX27969.1 50S ribosomal protein L32 [Candidatus Portnoybacteria bacterium]